MANRTICTYGPPVLKDHLVMKYCELDYNEPREKWIRAEKQLKCQHGVRNGTSFWVDSGASPWTVCERRVIQGGDGTLTAQLCQITIRSHWLLTATF